MLCSSWIDFMLSKKFRIIFFITIYEIFIGNLLSSMKLYLGLYLKAWNPKSNAVLNLLLKIYTWNHDEKSCQVHLSETFENIRELQCSSM